MVESQNQGQQFDFCFLPWDPYRDWIYEELLNYTILVTLDTVYISHLVCLKFGNRWEVSFEQITHFHIIMPRFLKRCNTSEAQMKTWRLYCNIPALNTNLPTERQRSSHALCENIYDIEMKWVLNQQLYTKYIYLKINFLGLRYKKPNRLHFSVVRNALKM